MLIGTLDARTDRVLDDRLLRRLAAMEMCRRLYGLRRAWWVERFEGMGLAVALVVVGPQFYAVCLN